VAPHIAYSSLSNVGVHCLFHAVFAFDVSALRHVSYYGLIGIKSLAPKTTSPRSKSIKFCEIPRQCDVYSL